MRNGDTVIGKYRLVRRLGSGGMGVVWEANHLVTGRAFAIKFLQGPTREEHYARFLQEARVSGLVRHPNIVDVYDLGTAPEIGGLPFLVMDLLSGLSLSEGLAEGRLSVSQTFAIVLPLLSGIASAHEAGIIHRDLKPSNLFLHRLSTGAVVPKVLDFGISKLRGPALDQEVGAGAVGRQRLTRTGAVLGSPLYMSPEQVRGDMTLDERSDLHAMGAIMWECLAGESLFSDALDDNELAAQIANGPRRALSDLRPEVPAELSAVIARCLAVRREDRVQSARELLGELERLQPALAPSVSLSDPRVASLLFPLTASKAPRKFVEATTVDSEMPPAPTAGQSPTQVSPASPSAKSHSGWGDRIRTGSELARSSGRRAIVGAAAVGALVVGVTLLRTVGRPDPTSTSPGAALADSPAPSTPPVVVALAPGASPAPAGSESAAPAASPVPSAQPAGAASAARRGRVAGARDAGAREPSGPPAAPSETSANGSPIIR